jgi:hypothetical protein
VSGIDGEDGEIHGGHSSMVVASMACLGEGASKWHDSGWRTSPKATLRKYAFSCRRESGV